MNLTTRCLGGVLDHFEMKILRCAEEHCLPNKRRETAKRTSYSLHFVTYGAGKIVYGEGKEVAVRRGDAFMVYPDYAIEYSPDPKNPWSYIWVQFEGSGAEEVFGLCGITREKPYVRIKNFSNVCMLIFNMMNAYDCTELQDVRCYGYFLVVLSALLENASEAGKKYESAKQLQRLAGAMTFIRANAGINLSVNDIAQSSCCSPSYLMSLFSKYLKMRPIEYQQHCRVAAACSLLQTDETMSIAQVAEHVGYADPLYFSRVFKKIKGVSPEKYRASRPDEDTQSIIPQLKL